MNSLNDKVCEYNSEPVTENFRTCEEAGGYYTEKCPSKCAIDAPFTGLTCIRF
jgi:hypothetical protein